MKKKLFYIVNHASFFVSHRLPIAIEANKNNYEVFIIFGKPSSEKTEPEAIKKILNSNIKFIKVNINNQKIFRIFDLIGLIQMMQNLSDTSMIGPGLAVALNTTFYGILISNLIFNPIAVKLSTRTDTETHLIKVIHAGIIGIKRKSHHLLVTEQMNSFLSTKERQQT